PDGKQVVSGLGDKIVRLWDAITGTVLQILEGHSNSVNSIAFSLNGNLLSTLCISDYWIVESKVNILWLSPDYRFIYKAIWDQIVILEYLSGGLSFLE
ncbi:hypothetical protein NA56DRAFT_528165, partial [Hyaloscypha hepaticicola]